MLGLQILSSCNTKIQLSLKEVERWYREQGINIDDVDEMFAAHIEEIQDPNHPLNRHNSNAVGTSDVCVSSRQKVNDFNENLIVELNDNPSQSDNIHEMIGSKRVKKSMKDQLELNWKFLQLHRKIGHMSED